MGDIDNLMGSDKTELLKSKEYLIGLDLGSSMIKGVLMSTDGQIYSTAREPMSYDTKVNGSVEFNANDFYNKSAGIMRQLVTHLPDGEKIIAISMASASGNTLLTDAKGNPIIQAISWMDHRADDEFYRIFGEQDNKEIYSKVGWPYEGGFPLAHLSWLKFNKPDLFEQASYISMSTEFINFRLTGKWGIDTSTATPFYLQDQLNACWNSESLDRLGFTECKLPGIQNSGTILGKVTQQAANETGLAVGTLVVLGSFDHPSAARSSGVLDEGQMLLSCGTSWVGLFPIHDRDKIIKWDMLADPFLHPNGPWAGMYSLPSISENIEKSIQHYISHEPSKYKEFDKLVASCYAEKIGLFIDPLEQDNHIVNDGIEKNLIAKAIMEGPVLHVKGWINAMKRRGIPISSAVMVGGPSESEIWPQIVSDVLQIPVSTQNGAFSGAIGAAILAGIGAGIYTDSTEAYNNMRFNRRVWNPDRNLANYYKELFVKYISENQNDY